MLARPVPILDRLDRLAVRAPARFAALAPALLAVYLQAHYFFLSESHEVDSYSYWFAAEAVAQGRDPYDTAALQAAGRRHELRLVRSDPSPPDIYAYVYPPPFAGLWRPMTRLSPVAAHRVLEVVNTLALGAALLLLHRVVDARRHAGLLFAAFALGLAVNGPAVSSTRLGQVNAPLLVAMLAATAAHRRRSDALSAAALGAATLVKLSPAMLGLAWSLAGEPRRHARYALLLLSATLALAVLSLPLAPWEQWRHFAAALSAGIPWQSEYSWWGWLTLSGARVPWLLTLRVPLYLAGAGLLLVCAWRHLRRVPREDIAVEGAATGVVFMLLLSPLTWQHHYLFFLLPAYAWVARAWAGERRILTGALALCAVLVLLRLPGSLLVIRPAATLAAFLLVTLAPVRSRAGALAAQ